MTWHVYPTIGQKDSFKPEVDRDGGDGELRIPIECPGDPTEVSTHRVWTEIDEKRLDVAQTAVDLYRLSVAVYTADLRIKRDHAHDGWTRDIALYAPVADPARWEQKKTTLVELLSFLTGDHWTVQIRDCAVRRPVRDAKARRRGVKVTGPAVSLFSGGLDSFIGAVDTLAGGEPIVLVGHYHDATPEQRALFDILRSSYRTAAASFLQFRISPPTALSNESERTQRSRSLLFLGLGVLAASGLGADAVLRVPENGFISLNAPLTGTRLGSLSTRTTHPHTLSLFAKLLEGLGIPVTLQVPYRFMTKGEMLLRCRDQELLQECARSTMSCAHPGNVRYSGESWRKHCGYCIPCLIRRAALHRVGLDQADDFTHDVLESVPKGRRSSADLRALLISLDHCRTRSAVASVLKAGPLPCGPNEVHKYASVYERGLQEVADFLREKKWADI